MTCVGAREIHFNNKEHLVPVAITMQKLVYYASGDTIFMKLSTQMQKIDLAESYPPKD